MKNDKNVTELSALMRIVNSIPSLEEPFDQSARLILGKRPLPRRLRQTAAQGRTPLFWQSSVWGSLLL